jgi:hypothetical protein
MTFSELIGKGIALSIPRLSKQALIPATLIGVESSGLWISGPDLYQAVNSSVGILIAGKRTTPAVFVPFSEIASVMVQAADNPSSAG